MPRRNGVITSSYISQQFLRSRSVLGVAPLLPVLLLLVMLWESKLVQAFRTPTQLMKRQAPAALSACAAVAEDVPTRREEDERATWKGWNKTDSNSLFRRLGNPRYIAAPMVEHSEAVSVRIRTVRVFPLTAVRSARRGFRVQHQSKPHLCYKSSFESMRDACVILARELKTPVVQAASITQSYEYLSNGYY